MKHKPEFYYLKKNKEIKAGEKRNYQRIYKTTARKKKISKGK